MELEPAARHRLLADATVTGYVVKRVFTHRLMESLKGTSGLAVVVRRSGGWSTPDQSRTAEYPLLTVQCWADPDRESGEVAVGNALNKAWALYRAVDPIFHMVRGERWGYSTSPPRDGLMIVRSSRWAEPSPSDSSSVSTQRGATFEQALLSDGGGMVEVSYACEVAHGSYA